MNSQIGNRSASAHTAVLKALHAAVPATFALLSAGPSIAGPEQGTVVQGTASFDAALPGTLNINQSSDRAVINWRSFSIGANETVNFNQPSSASATLNRVLSGQRSIIDGALNANGNVFLLNSSGVLFGAGSKVDVGGLVATTSSMLDDDFMRGQLKFSAGALPGASIANAGSISIREGGIAALVAPTVINQGVIAASMGKIGLGAGEVFTLDLYGDQMINFEIPASAQEALEAREIDQSGTITADGGRVLLTTDAASGVVDGVVNMSGIIRARSVRENAAGEIELLGGDGSVSVSGTLDASGTAGGTINVYGDSVSLANSASLDASGATAGGTIRIGGGLATESTLRASTTTVAAGATIDVSATQSGNAGTASVWGNAVAEFAGLIKARGGVAGGDGGMIEVSSHGLMRFLGEVHADAIQGKGGTLLLDPTNLTVEPTGGTDLTGSSVSGATIRSLLRQGVTVRLLADDTITVNDTIDGRPVDSQATSGAIELQAGTVLLLKPIITNDAAISINASAGGITFQGDAFLLVANSASAANVGSSPITLTAAQNIAVGHIVSLGRVSITSTAGSVQLAEALNGLQITQGATGIGELSVSAAQNISTAGVISTGPVSLAAQGTLTTSGLLRAGGNVSLSAGAGGVLVGPVGDPRNAAVQSAGNVSVSTPGSVSLGGGVLSQGGDISVGSATARVASLTMAAGSALQTAATSDQDGDILLYVGSAPLTARDLIAGTSGDVIINALGSVILEQRQFGLENSQGIGSLSVTAGGDIVAHGARAAGAIDLRTSSGSLENSGFSLISRTAGINLSAPGGIVLRQVTAQGSAPSSLEAADDVTLTTAGAVTIEGDVVSHGDNITIGSSATRVASLTMSNTAALQTADAVDQNGNISVFAGNGAVTTGNLVAGTIGNVLIDGQGTVSLANAVEGLQGAVNVGSLTVRGDGNVSLNGASVNGAIDVRSTTGRVENSGRALISQTAGINLQGSSIVVNELASGGPGAAALEAKNDITIASTGTVTLSGSVLSHGGNIRIGESSARVGSVSMATGTALQTADAGDQDGDILVYIGNSGFTARDLIAGTAGDVVIDTGGAVTFARNLFGLQGSNGIGSLDVTAGGNVALNGARTANNVRIVSDGRIDTASQTISNSGGVELRTTGTGEITINQVSSNSVPAVYADQDIAIRTGGAVSVGGDVFSGVGDILIGSDANRVGSVLTASGTALRTNATDGNVIVRSTGRVGIGVIGDDDGEIIVGDNGDEVEQSILAGTTGRVDITGSEIDIRGTISGSAAGSTGVGQVILDADRIAVHGIQVSDYLSNTALTNASPTNSAVRLLTNDRTGDISLLGPIKSGGPVYIGGRLNQNDYAVDATNAQINLSNSIFTRGQAVTLSGTVMLFRDISRWDIQCDIADGCDNRQYRDFDDSLFAPHVNAELEQVAYYGFWPNFMPDVYAEITGLDDCAECIVTERVRNTAATQGAYPACGVGDTCVDRIFVETPNFTPPYEGTLIRGDQVMLFANVGVVAADGNLQLIDEFNNNAICGGTAYVCSGVDGLRYTNVFDQTLFGGAGGYRLTRPAAADTAAAIARANQRIARYNDLFGSMPATISTTDGGRTDGNNVAINGNLERFRGGATTQLPDIPETSQAVVLPSFVSHAIRIDAGTAGEAAVKGRIGDQLVRSADSGNFFDDPVTMSHRALDRSSGLNGPERRYLALGVFDVDIKGNTVRLGESVSVGAPATYVDVLTTTGNVTFNRGPTLRAGGNANFAFSVGVTVPDASTYTSPNNQQVPTFEDAGSVSNPFTTGVGGAGTSGPGTGVGSADAGAGTGLPGVESGSAGSGFGGLLPPTADPTSPTNPTNPTNPTDPTNPSNPGGGEDPSSPNAGESGVNSVAEDTSRKQGEVETEEDPVDNEDECPRGAAMLADTGRARSVNGSAPDIFTRCKDQ